MEWTREQEIVALYLYCMIPFNKVNNSNPQIRKMAELIGRPNANSLKAKIGNFGKFDTNLIASGLGHTSHLDEEIWNEFNGNWQELELQALELIKEFQIKTQKDQPQISYIPIGREREVVLKQRANQYLFRNMVLSAYNGTCCITRIARPELIEACHIIDWKSDEKSRLNPCNGLAMNVLFHRAYDNKLIGISPDFKVEISDCMYDGLRGEEKEKTYSFFSPFNNIYITLPKKFKPNRDFIEQKYEDFKKAN
ncbi:HNH endonuclease [Sodaliphilus sp.]|uniref:HNH endonuclease n=1 Tax=Sodaliphilus sp. TaxID=2815818 RepID=UPI00388F84FF